MKDCLQLLGDGCRNLGTAVFGFSNEFLLEYEHCTAWCAHQGC